MNSSTREPTNHPDESRTWMGGEAAVGLQAEQHVRRQERSLRGLVVAVVGLAFVGGVTLGAVVSAMWRRRQ